MATTVHVKNISAETSEAQVNEFFSFCGKINSLSITPDATGAQSASVTFEKPTAAKTALLLDNTQLNANLVQVSPAASLEELSSDKQGGGVAEPHGVDSTEVAQEDKPRTRVLAEYLAHGYTVSDKAIEQAIHLDSQHGVSTRFQKALADFDTKFHATEKAQNIDQKYALSEKAASGWQGIQSYFEKALGTPTGQRVRAFYQAGNKQVTDVHNEARRLADLKKVGVSVEQVPDGTGKTVCNCGADDGKCGCEPGRCACASCPKNMDASLTAGAAPDYEKAQLEQIPGTDKTKCNCAGDTGNCPCAPGKCACASCGKNPDRG